MGAVGPAGAASLGSAPVSAGIGRATLVGTMSVPQSWAAAAPASRPAAATSPTEGWYNPPGIGGGVRQGRARHAGNADGGRPRRTRLGFCRPPLRVQAHRRRPSTGCRVKEGSCATTTGMRHRSWHRARRTDPPCAESSPRRPLGSQLLWTGLKPR